MAQSTAFTTLLPPLLPARRLTIGTCRLTRNLSEHWIKPILPAELYIRADLQIPAILIGRVRKLAVQTHTTVIIQAVLFITTA
jgi:hypothetical protein